ncbi:hypothetical protein CLU79DRAFT_849169 [Phycomyces nitens]|nr:hypothetical protein CLU79DRAFT_849169 [Phycomyces nitens]
MKLSLFTISALALTGLVSAAPAAGCAEKHIVTKGETCVSVASKFGITIKDFQGFNLGLGSEATACKSLVVGSSYCVKPLPVKSNDKRGVNPDKHTKITHPRTKTTKKVHKATNKPVTGKSHEKRDANIGKPVEPAHKPAKVLPKPFKSTPKPDVEHPKEKRDEKAPEPKEPAHKPSKVLPKPFKPTPKLDIEHSKEKRGVDSPQKKESTKKPVKTTHKPSKSAKNGHSATPKSAHHAARAIADCKKYHVVKSGETCASIAKENNITKDQLKEFNSGLSQASDSECQKLVAGQRYCISH